MGCHLSALNQRLERFHTTIELPASKLAQPLPGPRNNDTRPANHLHRPPRELRLPRALPPPHPAAGRRPDRDHPSAPLVGPRLPRRLPAAPPRLGRHDLPRLPRRAQGAAGRDRDGQGRVAEDGRDGGLRKGEARRVGPRGGREQDMVQISCLGGPFNICVPGQRAPLSTCAVSAKPGSERDRLAR